MRTVWRYELADGVITTPPRSRLLEVGILHEAVQCWFEVVHPELEPTELHYVGLVPTGEEVPGGMRYVKTITSEPFAWHVYEALTPAVASRIVARDAEPVTT